MCVTTHDRLKKHDLWLVETGCVNCSIQFRVLFQRCVFMLKFINDINHGAIKSKEMSKQISSTVKRVWRVAKLLQQNLFLVCQKCNRLPFGPIKPSSSSTKAKYKLKLPFEALFFVWSCLHYFWLKENFRLTCLCQLPLRSFVDNIQRIEYRIGILFFVI